MRRPRATIGVVVAVRRGDRLPDGVTRLAAALEALDLRVDFELARRCRDLSETIRNYLLPRLEKPGSPLLVVFAGPTGSGKSTLINSLTGLDLSATGPRRPTTRAPLFVVFEGTEVEDAGEGVVIAGAAPVLRHMTLVDTPDIDSTDTEHRRVAESLIDRADIVVFVVSALRYADQVPWEVLRRAASRGAAVVSVINRLPPGSLGAVTDFTRLLEAEGAGEHLIRVPEHHLPEGAARVPSLAVGELRRALFDVLAERARQQGEMVNRVVHALAEQVGAFVADVRAMEGRLVEIGHETRRRVMSGTVALSLP
ncbi:MAG: GTPase domain-containing protein, partial [Actinobacteria bacterium]|nr:GTPase domain-containing protein [Actinomycetota bacterium]